VEVRPSSRWTGIPQLFALLVVLALLAAACSMVQPRPAALGTEQNPLKLALSASIEPQRVMVAGEPLARQLEQATGLRIKLTVPTSHAAVVEAMGTHNVDVGWLAPFAYVLAHDHAGAEPLLVSVRAGSPTMAGQIVVHADSGITNLEGLRRKRIAFVESPSATGNLLPRALLLASGLDPASAFAEVTFLGSHEQVILAVYRRQVDAGATLGERTPGAANDARLTVQQQAPDVQERVRVLARTDPIPNDTIALRNGLPPELARQLRDGFLQVAASPAGAQALRDLDGIDGLAPVTDADFQAVRDATQRLGLSLDAETAPGRTPATP
jgi:phosphonate transport system substrate-binding protein